MAELGSQEALMEIAEHEEWKQSGKSYYEYDSYMREVARNDPIFIKVVEELGEEAAGKCAELAIVEVDDRAPWFLDEYDGMESIRQFNPEQRGCRLL
jgi:hypothetical protein